MYMRTIIFFLSTVLLVMATTVSATPNPIYKQAKIRRHDGGEGGGSGSGSSWGNTGGDSGNSWGIGGGDSGGGWGNGGGSGSSWGGSGGYPKPSKHWRARAPAATPRGL